MGTNFVLKYSHPSSLAAVLAAVITVLENYDGMASFISVYNSRIVATKLRDLFGGGNSKIRDLLKFYSKRLDCKCLKEMYSEARKTLPKMGGCFFCIQIKERALLMVCSRCRINQYCSRECQIADWPRHKCNCDTHVLVQKEQSMNSETVDKSTTTNMCKGL